MNTQCFQLDKDRGADKRSWITLAFGVSNDLKLCLINVGRMKDFEHPWSLQCLRVWNMRSYVHCLSNASVVFCNVISGFICVYVILNSLGSNNDWAVFPLL